MAKVYVVTSEPYHDNSTILGVYGTLAKAESKYPGNWLHEGYYVSGICHPGTTEPYRGAFLNCVSQRVDKGDDTLLIYEFDVET